MKNIGVFFSLGFAFCFFFFLLSPGLFFYSTAFLETGFYQRKNEMNTFHIWFNVCASYFIHQVGHDGFGEKYGSPGKAQAEKLLGKLEGAGGY